MAKSVVRSQMGGRAPSTSGVNGKDQYDCPPFSEHKHDTGNGGIPTVVGTRMNAKMPTSKAPAFSSPNAATGSPSQSTRRYKS
jgi:hypothetical protein